MKVVGVKITSNTDTALRHEISRRLMCSFLDSKRVLKGSASDVVDWEAIEHKVENKSKHYKMWITKHVSNICGTNHMINKRDPDQIWQYLCCKKEVIIEDTRYQLHCTDPHRTELWESMVQEFGT